MEIQDRNRADREIGDDAAQSNCVRSVSLEVGEQILIFFSRETGCDILKELIELVSRQRVLRREFME